MHQRFLAIDVFVIRHRRQHDRRMAVIRSRDDDRIELVAVFRKRFPVITASEGTGMFAGSFCEGIRIHITQTRDLH